MFIKKYLSLALAGLILAALPASALAQAISADKLFDMGQLKPTDSELKVKAGDEAPDFTLPSIKHGKITLSDYEKKKNVVLSFVPAAWTPVCSDQWPGYNIAKELFEAHDAVLLGITVDNIPTLFSWTHEMGDLWFPVLSDFWPHGGYAQKLGLLRGDGTAERAIVIIDKQGIIRHIDVNDINRRPDLGKIIKALGELN